jgi:hypothetical protein
MEMQTLEPYWLGVAVWLLGFMLYLYGAHWRYSHTVARIGAVFCWIGFAATAYPCRYPGRMARRFRRLDCEFDPDRAELHRLGRLHDWHGGNGRVLDRGSTPASRNRYCGDFALRRYDKAPFVI